jgi:thiol-disulfide isomerase/thioredoxin
MCSRAALLWCLSLLVLSPVSAARDTALPGGVRVYEAGPAPALQLRDMESVPFSLHNARGRWVLVHFWASWCGPCRKEMPAIQRMAKALHPDHLQVVLVNTAEDEDTVFTFVAAVAPEMNSLMDSDGQATEAWQPRGLPASYLVDPQGLIRYQALGGLPWDQPDYLDFLEKLPR